MVKRTSILITMVFVFVTLTGVAFADDQDRKREKKKDGTCLEYKIDLDAGLIIAGQNGNRSGDQDGTGPDQNRDGSCQDG